MIIRQIEANGFDTGPDTGQALSQTHGAIQLLNEDDKVGKWEKNLLKKNNIGQILELTPQLDEEKVLNKPEKE